MCIAIFFKINKKGWIADIAGHVSGGATRAINDCLKASYQHIAEYWHREFRPKHFTRGAFQRYPGVYKARTKKYRRHKLKTKGHSLPMVYSGETRTLSRIRNIKATATGVKIILRMPILNTSRKGGKVNMREEMTAVNARERATLIKLFVRQMALKINSIRATRTKRIAA